VSESKIEVANHTFSCSVHTDSMPYFCGLKIAGAEPYGGVYLQLREPESLEQIGHFLIAEAAKMKRAYESSDRARRSG